MDSILGNMFYSRSETAEWHKKGICNLRPRTAVETMEEMGTYSVEVRNLFGELNGEMAAIGDRFVVRSPVPTDPKERNLGTVGKDYKVIQPIDIARIYDEHCGAPVETLGILDDGGQLFVTWVLDPITVDNYDVVRTYGLLRAGYDGVLGNSLYFVSKRVVCLNTLVLAVQRAEADNSKTNRRLMMSKHNSKTAERDLALWMAHIQQKANDKLSDVSATFNNMAKVALQSKEEVYSLLFNIFPNPENVQDFQPEVIKAEQVVKRDEKIAEATKNRDLAYYLFSSAGTDIRPNVWGLMNSITEMTTHSGVVKKPIENSILFGNRAKIAERAYNVLAEYAEVNLGR